MWTGNSTYETDVVFFWEACVEFEKRIVARGHGQIEEKGLYILEVLADRAIPIEKNDSPCHFGFHVWIA